jgi:hypothetical protein
MMRAARPIDDWLSDSRTPEDLRQRLPIQPFTTSNASKKEIIDDLALKLEQGSLLARQGDRPAGPGDAPGRGIERQVTDAQHRVAAGALPAEQRTHARQQLGEVEGLDQVVVGASVEACDLVGGGVARREHENRDGRPAGPGAAADLEAGAARQQHVQHDQIGLLFGHRHAVVRSSQPRTKIFLLIAQDYLLHR